MTLDDVKRLLELEKAATAGPWAGTADGSWAGANVVVTSGGHPVAVCGVDSPENGYLGASADRKFIAEIRNAAPWLLRVALAEFGAACVMKQGEPFDFAWCETHDVTFPLGGSCKFSGRSPMEVLWEEADAQRQRAVRAELALERMQETAEAAEAATNTETER